MHLNETPDTYMVFCISIVGCNNTNSSNKRSGNKAKLVDTAYATFNRSDNIYTQIQHAKHNPDLILGKWKIIKTGDKNGGHEISKVKLNKMAFNVYDFISATEYTIYKKRKVIEKGTFELMANNREIVFTPNDDKQVSRLFIWEVNDKYLKASVKSSYMVFVKLKLAPIKKK